MPGTTRFTLARAILRSPVHGLLSRRVMLITVTAGAPECKRWWRNLRGGAPVTVEVKRVRHPGTAWARRGPGEVMSVDLERDDVATGHGISPG